MSQRRNAEQRERWGRRYALLQRLPDEWQRWWHDPTWCRRLLELVPVLALLFLAAPTPAAGQATSYGCCSFHDWATYGSDNLLRYHPTAHGLGGVAMDLVARTPLWSEKIRRGPVWRRLAIVAVLGAAWQFNNLKEIDGYRLDYAGFDLSTNLVAASLTELLFPVRRAQKGTS